MSKVVIITPEGKIEEREIEMTLKNLNEILGGHIETVPGFYIPQLRCQNILLLVNETGKIDNLKPTIAVIDETLNLAEILVGNVVCIGLDPAEDDFTGLTDAQVEAIKENILPLADHGIPFMAIPSNRKVLQ